MFSPFLANDRIPIQFPAQKHSQPRQLTRLTIYFEFVSLHNELNDLNLCKITNKTKIKAAHSSMVWKKVAKMVLKQWKKVVKIHYNKL